MKIISTENKTERGGSTKTTGVWDGWRKEDHDTFFVSMHGRRFKFANANAGGRLYLAT
jgi:hypothetical protein